MPGAGIVERRYWLADARRAAELAAATESSEALLKQAQTATRGVWTQG